MQLSALFSGATKRPFSRSLDSWKRPFSAGGRMLKRRRKLPASSRYSFFAENNKACTPQNTSHKTCYGGDKRDRTADLLNAIDGRSRVHQGQALQKEKPLKYRDFRVFAVFAHFTFLLHARLIFKIDCILRGCVTAPYLLLCGRMCWASSLILSWRRWR